MMKQVLILLFCMLKGYSCSQNSINLSLISQKKKIIV